MTNYTSQIPDDHVCAECPGVCTDPSLKCQDSASAQATALWRRSLIAVTEVCRVTPLPHFCPRFFAASLAYLGLKSSAHFLSTLFKRRTVGTSQYINIAIIISSSRGPKLSGCSDFRVSAVGT